MTRIDLPEHADLPMASRDILNEIVEAGQNKIINLQTGMAISTTTLAAYWAMRKAVTEHATLPPKTRFAIMLATAAADESDYSQRLNTHLALDAGWTAEEVLALQKGTAPGDPRLTSLLRLTQQAARTHGRVTDSTWSAARDSGWEPCQLLEAITHVALVGFVDLVTNLLELDPDGVPSPVPAAG